jgi:chromosome segregation ATPase
VWYHHTFESNPVVVNEQGISEPEAVTEDASTVESSQPPSEAEIEAAIAALENLHTTSDQSSSTDTDTESSTEQLSSISQSVTPDPPDREQIVAKIQELEAESTAIRKQYLGLIDMANELGAYAHWHGQNAATIEDLDAAYDSVPGTDAAAAERAHKKVMEIIDKFNREQQDIVDTINAVKEEADTLISQRNSILVEIKRLKASIGDK